MKNQLIMNVSKYFIAIFGPFFIFLTASAQGEWRK